MLFIYVLFNELSVAQDSGNHRLHDTGSYSLWNVGKRLPYYTAQQPKIQKYSYNIDINQFI